MHAAGPKNPLHGITLEKMVTQLQAHYGWEMLGRMIKINCFNWQPSVASSLKFLRRTPWARQQVERLYLETLPDFASPAPSAAVAAAPGPEIEIGTEVPTASRLCDAATPHGTPEAG